MKFFNISSFFITLFMLIAWLKPGDAQIGAGFNYPQSSGNFGSKTSGYPYPMSRGPTEFPQLSSGPQASGFSGVSEPFNQIQFNGPQSPQGSRPHLPNPLLFNQSPTNRQPSGPQSRQTPSPGQSFGPKFPVNHLQRTSRPRSPDVTKFNQFSSYEEPFESLPRPRPRSDIMKKWLPTRKDLLEYYQQNPV
ncbi:hypothetical protein KQX54_007818 [Cotesia glomerata]|uniref:Uncharacterized protein n=1 Tax=Cotesia glomerata TaxID=32391 RepID=A0AAV7J4Y3_COTGL|nr:hypothetical protein KQX54_007818 [Cotesia glomerata]